MFTTFGVWAYVRGLENWQYLFVRCRTAAVVRIGYNHTERPLSESRLDNQGLTEPIDGSARQNPRILQGTSVFDLQDYEDSVFGSLTDPSAAAQCEGIIRRRFGQHRSAVLGPT